MKNAFARWCDDRDVRRTLQEARRARYGEPAPAWGRVEAALLVVNTVCSVLALAGVTYLLVGR